MNNHEQYRILISSYLDGYISSQEKQLVEEHLRECGACAKYLREIKNISFSLRQWSEEDLSPDLEHKITNSLLNVKSKEGPKMKFELKLSPVGIGGSIFAILVSVSFGYLYFHTQQNLAMRMRSASDDLGARIAEKAPRAYDQIAFRDEKSMEGVKQGYSQPVNAAKAKDALVLSQSIGRADKSSASSAIFARSAESKTELAKAQYEPYYLQSNVRVAGLAAERQSSPAATPPVYAVGGFQSSNYGDELAYTMDEPAVLKEEEQEILPGRYNPNFNTESYDRIYENPFLEVKGNPLSTFSIDVDTASYSNMRRFLNAGQMPPKDSIRIEELTNYFSYDYPQPEGNTPVSITTEVAKCPWNQSHNLALVGLKGKDLQTENIPSSNLVFLIDVSGSMDEPNKLPLVKSGLRLLVENLRENDRVSIVVYAGAAGLVLDSTSGFNKEKIISAIENLSAGGSTAGGEGIKLAYQIAQQNIIKSGNNRVILATDGDFNVGVSSDGDLIRLIEEKRDQGIFLSVLGFGIGNYKDSKMEKIADKGNGNYSYIDTIEEAKKVLVQEMGATLFTIAKDVKIQVEFNPAKVKAYRLIGYENRILAKEDFNDDKKDAGEMGAGHEVTALYEIIPPEEQITVPQVDQLQYQEMKVKESGDLLTVKLRYKDPDGTESKLISRKITGNEITERPVSQNFQFASAVAEFGLLLRDSQYKGSASYLQVMEQARQSMGQDKWGYRSEFLKMVEKAGLINK